MYIIFNHVYVYSPCIINNIQYLVRLYRHRPPTAICCIRHYPSYRSGNYDLFSLVEITGPCGSNCYLGDRDKTSNLPVDLQWRCYLQMSPVWWQLSAVTVVTVGWQSGQFRVALGHIEYVPLSGYEYLIAAQWSVRQTLWFQCHPNVTPIHPADDHIYLLTIPLTTPTICIITEIYIDFLRVDVYFTVWLSYFEMRNGWEIGSICNN